MKRQVLKSQILIVRILLGINGIMLVLMSGMVAGSSVFGTHRFTVGMVLHLLGQILCISALCLPGWLFAYNSATESHQRITSEPAMPDSALRPAQFHMGTQTMRLFYGLALLSTLLYGLIANGIQFSHLLQLRQHGIRTNATITGTSFREGKSLMNVNYSFTTAAGFPIVASFKAPRRFIREMRTGNTLPVTYLPVNPDVHMWQEVDNGLILRRVLSGVLLFTTILVYFGFPVIVMESRLRRQLRLARAGIAATGTIVSCKPLVWRARRYGYWLTSIFLIADGERYTSQAFVSHVPGEPTLPGFPITVLYDPAQPSTNLPLAAFHAVRMTTLRKSILALSKL